MRININVILLYIILILADNIFWLFPLQIARSGQDLAMLIIVIICFVSILKNKKSTDLEIKNKLKYLMLFPFIMSVYSSVIAHFRYGQNIIQDILAQRHMFVGFLVYFPISWLINRDKKYLDKLIHVLVVLGAIEVIIYLPQFFLADKFIYLNCNITNRLGSIRLYTSSCAIPILIFYCFNSIMLKKRGQLKFWLGMSAGLYYSIVVSKTRIAMVAYLVSIIIGFILWKRGGMKKVLMIIPILIGLGYLLNTELFKFLVDGLNAVDNSSQIRIIGREYYISQLIESLQNFLFGTGFINSDSANYFSGVYSGIYAVDLGIYAIAFIFGLFGVIWLIVLFYNLYKMSWKLTKSGNYFCLMYLIYLTVIVPNGTAYIWQIQASLVLCLIGAYIEKSTNN
ncbi:hypothetical protein ACV3XD_13215 [Clostridium perfringens]